MAADHNLKKEAFLENTKLELRQLYQLRQSYMEPLHYLIVGGDNSN
jgi:hypothetical protein